MAIGRAGRRSAAELSVVQIGTVRARPDPPDELTDEQSIIWRSVIDRMPADWFQPENLPLLAQYCRHTVSARRVAELIAGMEGSSDFDVEVYDRLLKMQEREGRAMSALATRMRLTQHSSYDAKKKKTTIASKPWDDE